MKFRNEKLTALLYNSLIQSQYNIIFIQQKQENFKDHSLFLFIMFLESLQRYCSKHEIHLTFVNC